MASRMDLEARLRALREPRASAAPPAQPPRSLVLPPVVSVAVPSQTVANLPAKRPVSSPPRPNFATFDDARQASTKANAAASKPAERPYAVPSPAPAPPAVDMAKVLGPAYEEAVLMAQFAIDCERQRLVHTAIDNYIRAGQALVAIGRQQTAPHLQAILKSKALALLQRAEGLDTWANRIIAENKASAQANGSATLPSTRSANEATLRAAIAQSQQQDEQALSEKEALVSKIKTENNELLQRLNQFVVLAKVRTRFSRVISARRARKAQEAERRMSLTGEGDENHDNAESTAPVVKTTAHATVAIGPLSGSRSASSSPREEQKRALVNELHARIGLPEVDHFRTFKPLGESADHDRRQDALEQELEDVRVEAERLRAAVQEMEQTMKLAAEHSRERSIKLEKQKEEEVTQLQMELERVKSALDLERKSSGKRSSVYLDSDDDDDDDDDEDEDTEPRPKEPDAFEDNDMINKLRTSLLGLGYEEHSLDDDAAGPQSGRRASLSRSRGSSGDRVSRVARASLDHSSPRHSSQRMGSWGFDRDDEKHEEGDDDDGMWV